VKTFVATALAITAAAFVALPVTAASAATYVSQLEYRDGATGVQTPSFGTVTIDELNAQTLKVTVTLTTLGSLFISNGGPHNPFVFNTKVSDLVTILSPIDTFVNGGRGSFNSTPFGTFTNDIACCGNHPGASSGETPPLVFTVHDANGITFAGLGATFAPSGKLLSFGTGSDDHFFANNLGYMFAADIFDKSTGLTYNVAAKNAFMNITTNITTGVPEPTSWSLMLLGFGGLGATLRANRRRTAVAATA
jgi:hypothetical protein